ncbi:MAG TPA: carboxypeptidase-like regulatory domain-containing protein, partial [Blastocatellia bacterium]|nr:carboxypeptidase-like regulatory domain-containing protein [Blastocatellia bacterium]
MNSPCAPSSWRRLRSSFFWLIVTSFLGSTSPTLFAQTNAGAIAVRGRVTDASGAGLTGASVTLGNLATGLERVVTTDA